MLCPCCSELPFKVCCQPALDGKVPAKTPQALMRSRYSAYVIKNIEYIYNTYAQSSKKQQNKADINQWAQSVCFVHLEIVDHSETTSETSEGFVEFIASYIDNNKLHQLHERSRFVKESGLWKYIDGVITPHPPIALKRNDPCPCNSGKKYKKCHG